MTSLLVGRVALDERELAAPPRACSSRSSSSGDELAQVGVGLRCVEVVVRLAPLLRELVRALELLQAPADRRRLAVVVVDGGVGQALLRLVVGALELVDQLFEGCRGHRRREVSPRAVRRA